MGIMDFIKGELIDVIEWTDDSRDTLSYRYPTRTRPSERRAADRARIAGGAVHVPRPVRRHLPPESTADDRQHPVLTKLQSWKYGFNSLQGRRLLHHDAPVHGNKWGTANPVMARDNDFGIVACAVRDLRLRIVDRSCS